jgi:hypothetical protein
MGTFAGGAEEWSTGFYMGNEAGDADLPTQSLADSIAVGWRNFMIAPASQISGRWTATTVKVSSLGTDGKSNAADTVYANVAAGASGTGTLHYPPQIALVATMTSPIARGVGSKGRMYLPGVGMATEGDGKILIGAVNGIRDTLATFFNAVNGLPDNNVVVLASHGSLNADGSPKIGGSTPIIKAVTGIKIGTVYDTQRRRRNGLTEQYSSVSLV